MLRQMMSGATIAATALWTAGVACALEGAQNYPDWKGQWNRAPTGVAGQPQPPFDPSKPWGIGQEAPFTPEYQAIYEANLADQAAGGPGLNGASCRAHGIPMMMNVLGPIEILIEPELTYMLGNDVHPYVRRVYTDGRDWPESFEPGLHGLAIGRWIDTDGDGRYDTLEIETRGFSGPRVYDDSGLPLHRDNQSIVKERLYLDRADRNMLHNEITVIDHGLTRPWTVMKNYRRNPNVRPVLLDTDCEEGQVWMQIGNENYYRSADGMLMPTKKGQAPPDLRYFQQR
jgi:hypothetical protein